MPNEIQSQQNKTPISAYIWMSLSLLYLIFPLDIIPDFPILGWIDDFFVTGAAALNLLQKYLGTSNSYQTIVKVLQILKWIFITLGIIILMLLIIFGAAIVSWLIK